VNLPTRGVHYTPQQVRGGRRLGVSLIVIGIAVLMLGLVVNDALDHGLVLVILGSFLAGGGCTGLLLLMEEGHPDEP
jgi:hypothetical protein